MTRLPPRSTRTDPLLPDTTLFRSPGDVPNSAASRKIPADAQILGNADPNVRKPTAIVNDAVITGTDVDQRVALIKAANNMPDLPPADLERLRLQILAQLIDETLQIQEAKANEIRSEEHTPELQSLMRTPYAFSCSTQKT